MTIITTNITHGLTLTIQVNGPVTVKRDLSRSRKISGRDTWQDAKNCKLKDS